MPFDHFGAIAGLYDRAGAFQLPPSALQRFDLSPRQRLLDAGGGTGRAALFLRPLVGEVTVADPSKKMLAYACKKGLRVICSTAEQMPLESARFDRIIMVDAFHHVASQKAVIEELWRLLGPQGKLLIMEPDIHLFSARIVAAVEKLLLMRSHIISGEEIAALFNGKAARIEKMNLDFNVLIFIEKVK